MDYSPPDSSVHRDSPGKNTGVVCHALLQGIFTSQGLNPGLPQCRRIFYHLSHQGCTERPLPEIKPVPPATSLKVGSQPLDHQGSPVSFKVVSFIFKVLIHMELNFCAVSPLSTYEPSSCELSKMQMCVPKSSHISELTCLAYMCVHPLQRAVLLCPFL